MSAPDEARSPERGGITRIADELRKVLSLIGSPVNPMYTLQGGAGGNAPAFDNGKAEIRAILDRLIPKVELMEGATTRKDGGSSNATATPSAKPDWWLDAEKAKQFEQTYQECLPALKEIKRLATENAPQSHRNAPRSDEEAYNAEMVEKIVQASAEPPTVFFNSVEEFNEWMDNNAQEGK